MPKIDINMITDLHYFTKKFQNCIVKHNFHLIYPQRQVTIHQNGFSPCTDFTNSRAFSTSSFVPATTKETPPSLPATPPTP